MSNVPNELKYVSTHEWVLQHDDGSITVGITDPAQELLGDLVYVEVPEVDLEVAATDSCVVLESVKAASDVYAPVTGKITAVNEQLEDNPELINSDPYGEGWVFKMQVSDVSELDNLLDAASYLAESSD